MAALLVALSVMGIMLGAALPAWRTMVQREREAELVFRGEQYVQAIESVLTPQRRVPHVAERVTRRPLYPKAVHGSHHER